MFKFHVARIPERDIRIAFWPMSTLLDISSVQIKQDERWIQEVIGPPGKGGARAYSTLGLCIIRLDSRRGWVPTGAFF